MPPIGAGSSGSAASHLSRVARLDGREYRDAFRLRQKDATVTEGTSALYRQNAKLRLATGELKPTPKGGRRTARNTPGEQPVPRWRSLAELRPAWPRELHATRNGNIDPKRRAALGDQRCGGAARAAACSGSGTYRGRGGRRLPACGRQRSSCRPWPAARIPGNRWQSCIPASPPSSPDPKKSPMPPRSALGLRARSGGSVRPAPTNGRRRHRTSRWRHRRPRCDRRRIYGPSLPGPGPISRRAPRRRPRNHRPAHTAASGGAARCGHEGSSRPRTPRAPSRWRCRSCRARATLAAN